ncbi:hypothetical protein H072_7953 [Dactylellina haptotyla CBS 200.50]|uniref:EGF-like domain-containing protein n=1 Tax=Dactylellina haptotyla (strain CBS 200.50) TaxID=1284197 RepID=S8AB29_DACHA|nr:hypothetical protein H072_7953 [Dactylellina haptotyla CBS 200.50]
MRRNIFTSILALLAGAQLAIAAAPCTKCNADNCARRITGNSNAAPMTQREADCSSFMRVTKHIGTATTTVWRTVTVTSTAGGQYNANKEKVKRGAIPCTEYYTPNFVPEYATPCSGTSRYSSACSCWGITLSTITQGGSTVKVTSTSTVTRIVTRRLGGSGPGNGVQPPPDYETTPTPDPPSCYNGQQLCHGSCKNIFGSDTSNCGGCGVGCEEGATCINGVCTAPACFGIEPWDCTATRRDCRGNMVNSTRPDLQPSCFCLEGWNGTSYCTAFANLPICAQGVICIEDSDCGDKEICAKIPCCSEGNICVAPHGGVENGSDTCSDGGPLTIQRFFRMKGKQKRSAIVRGQR